MNDPRLQKFPGTILSGPALHCHIAWSRRMDGPMNIIGVENFPALSKEAGDNERRANRGYFLKHAINVDPEDTVVPKLVHGNQVKYVSEHNEFIEDLSVDGLVTETPNLALTVGFADCPSVVVFDVDTPALTLLHAGWKGIAAGILENAVMKMKRLGSHPSRMKVFIGPSIRRCCYEVGPEVATAVYGLEHIGRVMLDLPDMILTRLVVQGIPIEEIQMVEECTKCAVDKRTGKPLYWSYRREQKNNPLDTGMFVAVLR